MWAFYLTFSLYASSIYPFSFGRTIQSSSNRRLRRAPIYDAGENLYLTPLIDAGNFSEAKNRSRVEPPLLDGVNSYTGFLTVNKTTKAHLFYWFIPKTNDSYDSHEPIPLILWLQGGPGCSSLYGLFVENGPLSVDKEGRLSKRQYAWTDNYHVLYIDQPVGTGFSFTENPDGYATNELVVAQHLYEALQQFYQIFSDLRTHDLYVAGESYAGKYVPALGYKIHTANGRLTSASNIPLRGMMIGNGVSDPESILEYDAQLRFLGLVDERKSVSMREKEKEIKYLIYSGQFEEALYKFGYLRSGIRSTIGFSKIYDYRRDNSSWDEPFENYLSQDGVRKRIHVGRSKYSWISLIVTKKLVNDIMQTVQPWVEALLEHYSILFYNGQMDIAASHSATENFLGSLHWSGAFKFYLARQKKWQVSGSVVGYYRSAGNLVYVMVRNAGHTVPADQPRNSLILIDTFIKKQFYEEEG